MDASTGTRPEPAVAQAATQLVAFARTTSRGLKHPAINRIGFLHGFESFRHPPGALAGTPEGEQEQKDGEADGAPAERRPCPWPGEQPGGEGGDHRRPAFQSSMRA